MKIACCIWALGGTETDILRQVRELGFDWIDVQPMHLQTLESQLLLQELGMQVSCLGASFGMREGASLDHADPAARLAAVKHVMGAVDSAARIAADTAYVVPGKDKSPVALERYGNSLRRLADAASERGIKFAVEHFPGTALPTASVTLEFIRRVKHANLYLLYDSGHIQMSGEDPETVIVDAADRLGYVHLDDNDGISDLHWSLLDGVMTENSLDAILQALAAIGYQGALSLELNPGLRKPAAALSESRDIVLSAMHRLQQRRWPPLTG